MIFDQKNLMDFEKKVEHIDKLEMLWKLHIKEKYIFFKTRNKFSNNIIQMNSTDWNYLLSHRYIIMNIFIIESDTNYTWIAVT